MCHHRATKCRANEYTDAGKASPSVFWFEWGVADAQQLIKHVEILVCKHISLDTWSDFGQPSHDNIVPLFFIVKKSFGNWRALSLWRPSTSARQPVIEFPVRLLLFFVAFPIFPRPDKGRDWFPRLLSDVSVRLAVFWQGPKIEKKNGRLEAGGTWIMTDPWHLPHLI